MLKIEDMSVDQLNEEIDEFLGLYANRPLERNFGGLEYEGSFCLYHVLKQLAAPQLISHIMECGVWHGASSWLMERIMDRYRPGCEFIHSDPILEKCPTFPRYRTARGIYTHIDFLRHEYTPFSKTTAEAFVFFDDHQDVIPRLARCVELGIKHVLLDDNWDVYADHMTWNVAKANPDLLCAMNRTRFEQVKLALAEVYQFPRIVDQYGVFKTQQEAQNITYMRFQ